MYKSKVGEREYRTLKQTRKMDRQEPWEKEEAKGRRKKKKGEGGRGTGGLCVAGTGAYRS
jgi:hypothetical protein